ncbi:hypothetical protein ARSQ2_01965 [Arsenophonus endosymbiont of Bemisia tabaci Q2]|nr:hypothetical protein ARSQ2_01965 [Arsenophonus endosymbiont of Bemisia tabaci Q2]
MVEYLPTYSPDLNPIEHKWTQAKCKKRALGCDTDILFALNMGVIKIKSLSYI